MALTWGGGWTVTGCVYPLIEPLPAAIIPWAAPNSHVVLPGALENWVDFGLFDPNRLTR